jgi:hypothetical protein
VDVDTGSVSRRDAEGRAYCKDTEGLCAPGGWHGPAHARSVAAVPPRTRQVRILIGRGGALMRAVSQIAPPLCSIPSHRCKPTLLILAHRMAPRGRRCERVAYRRYSVRAWRRWRRESRAGTWLANESTHRGPILEQRHFAIASRPLHGILLGQCWAAARTLLLVSIVCTNLDATRATLRNSRFD